MILGLGLRVRLKREGRLGLREMGSKNETRPNRITKGRNKIIIIILMLILIKIIIILELIIVLIIILLEKDNNANNYTNNTNVDNK